MFAMAPRQRSDDPIETLRLARAASPQIGSASIATRVAALQSAIGNRALARLAKADRQALHRACCASCAAGRACEDEHNFAARLHAHRGPPRAIQRQSWWEDAQDAAAGTVAAVTDTVATAASQVEDAVTQTAQTAAATVQDTVSSTANAVSDAAASTAQAVQGAVASATKPIIGTLQPDGPSSDAKDDLASRGAGSPLSLNAGLPMPDQESLPWYGVKYAVRCFASIVGLETTAYLLPALAQKKTSTDAMKYLIEVFVFGEIGQSDKICHCIPRDWWLTWSRWYLKDYPLALKHFDHYLEGSGTAYVEDMTKLFADNPSMRGYIQGAINDAGVVEGDHTTIDQLGYDSEEWHLALGNIDHMRYRLLRRTADGQVVTRLELLDPYQWHPAEYIRGGERSRCSHVAAEFAKEAGAREFNEVGTIELPLRISTELAQQVPAP